jgi:hypothetical protein
VRGTSIEGLWVVLVPEDGDKVPMLARTGSSLYLLTFGNGGTARKFIADRGLEGAEPRLVVSANLGEIVSYVNRRGVTAIVVDYDAETNTYRDAGLVY